MSLANFLTDLNESFKKKEAEKRSREEALRREEKQKKDFLREFNEIYAQSVVRKIKKVEKNLKKEFKIKYKDPPEHFSREVVEGNITFYPKFNSGVYEAKIVVQGQYKARELTITGSAVYRLNAHHKGTNIVYKDAIERFDPSQIENYLTQVLRHYFIEG
ncbi:hypothetical protein H8S95_10690 [Pontibacter sp. KCTC 32443]|uniref:hypothetical protein n=1 Tax=Pontibacter TaxID=323449 RepID=UPI00164D7DCF|nr:MULTISPECIES: hypothetical protein [Pontibacter]MBC5774528.1 hypothetical protein [Pontibacter sp. KCTC 32443]